MFQKKPDKELWRLQQELLAAEEEDYEEEYEDDLDELDELTDDAGAEYEEYFDSSYEEEYDQPHYKNCANRYGRGSQKLFDKDDFFDDEEFRDNEVVYKKDYKKAKRKKRRQNMGLLILAILELICIAAILIWWASWTL